tara:strand:+ start:555 stop:731 length:177 start_codon:yes stop_codon:yes gene_type:complete
MNGDFKVASDQMLYNSMDMCEASMATQLTALVASKPTPDAYVTGTCTEMPKPNMESST